MMLFPAVLMNFPNSKVCLIGMVHWGMVQCLVHYNGNDMTSREAKFFFRGGGEVVTADRKGVNNESQLSSN